MLAVLADDTNPEHSLTERRSGRGFAEDVVTDAERQQQPERVAADIDAGICITVATLRVPTAGHQPDDDAEWEEDDHSVQQDGDEAEWNAGVLE